MATSILQPEAQIGGWLWLDGLGAGRGYDQTSGCDAVAARRDAVGWHMQSGSALLVIRRGHLKFSIVLRALLSKPDMIAAKGHVVEP